MPKATAAALAALLLALGLAACTASEPPTYPYPAETIPAETAAPPLAAETPDSHSDDANAAFLADLADRRPANSSIAMASDDQLIAAGHDACAQIRSGTDYGDVRVVEGEEPDFGGYYRDSGAVMNAALTFFCPELG